MNASSHNQLAERFQQQLQAYFILRDDWKLHPERYCRERLGMRPTWQQRKVLEGIAPPGAKVSVRAGHSIGKDAVAAAIIFWFMECFTIPKVACTAPSGHQLRDVLWGELAKWMRRSESVSRSRGDLQRFWLKHLFKVTQDQMYSFDAPREWYAVARTARKEKPEALQGLHASDIELNEDGSEIVSKGDSSLLYVIDEASGVPDEIYQTAEGALASPDCRLLLIGNPTRNTGYFADSHKKNRAEYTVLHFRSQDSPLVDPDYRARLVRKFGEGSNVVRVRADGEFPRGDDDALIPIEFCEAALQRRLDDVPAPVGKKRMGIDVAWGGVDRTAFVMRHGHVVPHIAVHAKLEPMEVAGLGLHYAQEWGIDEISVDVIGIGAGVYSRLSELRLQGKLTAEVIAVNVAEKAPPMPETELHAGFGGTEAQPRLIRDYLWLAMREWLRDEPVVFAADRDHCESLAGELSSPKLKVPDSEGRLSIESKDEMKRRLRQAGATDIPNSPDIADALGCTFAPHHGTPILAPDISMTHASAWRL